MTPICAPIPEKPSPWDQFTCLLNKINSTFIVSTIAYSKLVHIVFTGFWFGHYKGLPSMNNTFTDASFLFSSHTFSWACGSLCEPWKYFSNSLFVNSLVCPIPHSFLDGFQPTLATSMLYLSYYLQPKESTSMCL